MRDIIIKYLEIYSDDLVYMEGVIIDQLNIDSKL